MKPIGFILFTFIIISCSSKQANWDGWWSGVSEQAEGLSLHIEGTAESNYKRINLYDNQSPFDTCEIFDSSSSKTSLVCQSTGNMDISIDNDEITITILEEDSYIDYLFLKDIEI